MSSCFIERPQPLDENVVEEAAAPVHRDADAGAFERPGGGLARELARNGMAAMAQNPALPDPCSPALHPQQSIGSGT